MGWYITCVVTVRPEQHSPAMRGTGGAFRSYGAQMRGLWHMFIMLACFELLTQPDGSHRRRCCVRRIILTRTLAFGRRRCRPLQQGCCGSNTCRFHRQDRRKSTLECRLAKMAFFRRPRKNEPKSKKPRSFKKARKSRLFLKPGFVKNGSNFRCKLIRCTCCGRVRSCSCFLW